MATIITKNSSTAAAVPLVGDLQKGELAVNVTDKRLFTKDNSNVVVEVGTAPSTLSLPNGTANGVAYLNGSKVLTTGSALTFDGNGNLTLGGATPRLLSNMSGPLSTRLIIQNSTTNGNTRFLLYPNGTGNISAINGTNTSDINAVDYQAFDLAVIGTTDVRLSSNAIGTATPLPLTFWIGNSEQMRLTTTGLGIGTSSPVGTLTLGKVNLANGTLRFNGATTGADFMYMTNTGAGGVLGIESSAGGAIVGGSSAYATVLYTANSTSLQLGTNSLIRATLDPAGNLGLGVPPSATSSPYKSIEMAGTYWLSGNGTTPAGYWLVNSYFDNAYKYKTSGFAATQYSQVNGSHLWFNAPSGTAGAPISFTQAMTLDASGNLGIGTSAPIFRVDARGASGTGISYIETTTGNANRAQLGAVAGAGYINATAGAGEASLQIRVADSPVATFDQPGNLGLGVTPSAWNANFKALQIGAFGTAIAADTNNVFTEVFNNAYASGASTYTYVASLGATRYSQQRGQHAWYTAPSGTAGAPISFSQAMTLDASARLGINTTDTANTCLHIANSDPFNRPFKITNTGGSNSFNIRVGTGASLLATSGAQDLLFGTNDTERARITSGGYFKASNTGVYNGGAAVPFHEFNSNAGNVARFYETATSGGDTVLLTQMVTANGSAYHFQSLNGATAVYRVLANGNVQNTNNSYGAISDLKLKENITDATPKLASLNQLRVVNYNLKGDNLKQIGLIAQEVEQVFPGLVEETPDVDPETKEPTGEVTKAVKYSVLVPMLLKAVQELTAEVNALKAQIQGA